MFEPLGPVHLELPAHAGSMGKALGTQQTSLGRWLASSEHDTRAGYLFAFTGSLKLVCSFSFGAMNQVRTTPLWLDATSRDAEIQVDGEDGDT